MTFKELLKQKNLTMYQLAKDIEVGQSTINEIANYKRKAITIDTAIKIANRLEIKVELLYEIIRRRK